MEKRFAYTVSLLANSGAGHDWMFIDPYAGWSLRLPLCTQ